MKEQERLRRYLKNLDPSFVIPGEEEERAAAVPAAAAAPKNPYEVEEVGIFAPGGPGWSSSSKQQP